MIRVLVVDDSALIRSAVCEWINAEPDLTVIGQACDGADAVAQAERLTPDVIILDVEMPRMSGLEALEQIRPRVPNAQVIMFSTVTQTGSAQTVSALLMGASDYVTKPSSSNPREEVRERLVARVRVVGRHALRRGRALLDTPDAAIRTREPVRSPIEPLPRRTGSLLGLPRLVVVASSTGGPAALQSFISALGIVPVATVVVQHMPSSFLKLLAERLDCKVAPSVRVASGEDVLEPGEVLLASGGVHLGVAAVGDDLMTTCIDAPPENSCKPSADVLFRTAAAATRGRVIGVVLTGMGRDGATGSRILVERGGMVLVQSEASSVVWGMPGAVVASGIDVKVGTPDDLGCLVRRRLGAFPLANRA
ncbi:MAG: chemotaxis-specific protein-glutamate methyltransferase CheB [Ferrimicrobium sp.]